MRVVTHPSQHQGVCHDENDVQSHVRIESGRDVRQPGLRAGARGFGWAAAAALAMLIGNESVQKELKLDDEQVEKAKEFAEKAREEMREKTARSWRASRAKSAARRCKRSTKR